MSNRIRIAIAEWLLNCAADLMVMAGRLCAAANRTDYAENILRVLEYGVQHQRMNEKWKP